MTTIPKTESKAMERLAQLGLELPPPFPSYGNYVMAARAGRTPHYTGHAPIDGDRPITGKVVGAATWPRRRPTTPRAWPR